MNNIFKYVCFIFLILSAFSCREPYDSPVSDSDKKILVVDGMITSDPGPYLVKLSQAVSYSKDNQVAVKKAIVYVLDESNNVYNFKEKKNSPGQYISDTTGFRGEIGKSYTLYVKTTDGLEYMSTPCKIGPQAKLDSLYGFNERYLLFAANTQFNDEDTYSSGFHAYADLSFDPDEKISTKLDAYLATRIILTEWHFIYEKRWIIIVSPDSSHIDRIEDTINPGAKVDSYQIVTTYYTTKSLNITPILKTNSDYVAGSKIKKISIAYADETQRTDTIDETTYYTYGGKMIFILNAYTISNETFNYFYDLSSQIGGKNTFFEPIPVQLIGNMRCTNDSTQSVFGIFQANSVVKRYISIEGNSGNYHWSPATGIPPTKSDSITSGSTTFK
jgi:hypothetical protein